jgi:ferric-dicitrate binding protein FerR (iron transport regulator)
VSDDELEARLKRLDVRPEKDAAFWDAMSAEVRAQYDAAAAAPSRPGRRRRRRWVATPLAGALALAAALVLYVRLHRGHVPAPAEPLEIHVLEDDHWDELLERLEPAQLERLEKAFKHGA